MKKILWNGTRSITSLGDLHYEKQSKINIYNKEKGELLSMKSIDDETDCNSLPYNLKLGSQVFDISTYNKNNPINIDQSR